MRLWAAHRHLSRAHWRRFIRSATRQAEAMAIVLISEKRRVKVRALRVIFAIALIATLKLAVSICWRPLTTI